MPVCARLLGTELSPQLCTGCGKGGSEGIVARGQRPEARGQRPLYKWGRLSYYYDPLCSSAVARFDQISKNNSIVSPPHGDEEEEPEEGVFVAVLLFLFSLLLLLVLLMALLLLLLLILPCSAQNCHLHQGIQGYRIGRLCGAVHHWLRVDGVLPVTSMSDGWEAGRETGLRSREQRRRGRRRRRC